MPVAQSQYREEKVNVIYFPLYSDFEIKYLPVHLPEAEGITVICFFLHNLIKNKKMEKSELSSQLKVHCTTGSKSICSVKLH